MGAYIVRRLMLLPVILIGVTLLIFLMMMLVGPANRVSMYVRPGYKGGVGTIEKLIHKYGFDRPAYEQYYTWLDKVVHGNLGWSQSARMGVTQAIGQALPATAELTLCSVWPIIFLGIWMGFISGTHQDKPIDQITRVVAITGWSLPIFVLGLLLLMIFYGVTGWFPPGRLSLWAQQIVMSSKFHNYTGMYILDSILNGNWRILLDALRHMVLPVITLSYASWALILRIMRSSMLETLRQDYVRTARAKGLSEKVVLKKHARRNALIPVATISGLMIIGLLGGVVLTETIFNIHGLGRFAAQAALAMDLPAILGFALFYGFVIVFLNLLVDISYGLIDPRVRYE
ncbi:MAG TPA: ABC transporter permease [Candidatus Acetothermia bacterium]|nr:ABC transporter permease [Candidatus Acetothermia bacterium]